MKSSIASLGLLTACLTVDFSANAQPALAPRETIAVIGTGRVGGTLGSEWGQLGHTIVYGSRDPSRAEVAALVKRSGEGARATTPAEAVRDAGIVLFAVPWDAAETSARSIGDLKGKIVIDVTNPLMIAGGQMVEKPVPRSGSELIQSWLPNATVVKAFNALNWRVMADPAGTGGPVTVPLASDSADAKARVARLVQELGLEPFDAGRLANAKYLEGMAILYVDALSRKPPEPFEFHLRRR